jgi:hypothetical protein
MWPKNRELTQIQIILVQGSVRKYTEYTGETGITKKTANSTEDNHSCDSSEVGNDWKSSFLRRNVIDLVGQVNEFGEEREWQQFHTPRNLQLAVINEIGELSQIFQFLGDDNNQIMSVGDRIVVGLELADITMYLLRLAESCSVTDRLWLG